VLHLASRVAFGVDVADLFEFQRPFESDREIDPAAEIQEILHAEKLLRKLLDQVRIVQ